MCIRYEEYHPYGSIAWWLFDSSRGVSETRYKYAAMERDDETRLQRHGVRYYACWLSRWISTDPSGPKDHLVLYSYGRDNPIRHFDSSGQGSVDPTQRSDARDARNAQATGAPSESPPQQIISPHQAYQSDVATLRTLFTTPTGEQGVNRDIDRLLLAFSPSAQGSPLLTSDPEMRFQALLAATSSDKRFPTHFPLSAASGAISDSGFDSKFRDSPIWALESSNQAGHFLTASDISYSRITGGPTTYLGLPMVGGIIASLAESGHEGAGDQANGLQLFVAGMGTPTIGDDPDSAVTAFNASTFVKNNARLFAEQGYNVRSEHGQLRLQGSSDADVALTALGNKFGELMAEHAFKSNDEVVQWLRENLESADARTDDELRALGYLE